MQKRKFKTAVIGCGNIGASIGNYSRAVQPGTHAGAYLDNARTQLVALVEARKERRPYLEKTFPGVRVYKSAQAMFDQENPDIVSIAASTQFHHELVLLAARNKCPAILCEKPIAYNLKEAKEMIAACKKSGSLLFINHQRHFDSMLQKWIKKIKNGLLGQVYQGNIYYYNGLFNNGTHLIDILRMILGDPSSVMAHYNTNTSESKEHFNIDGLLFFKSGSRITMQSLSRNYGFFNIRLLGEKGLFDLVNLLYEVNYQLKVNNKNFKGFFELSPKVLKEGKPRSMISSSVAHVVACLDGKVDPVSTGEDGLAVLKILTALKQSADRDGKKINLK